MTTWREKRKKHSLITPHYTNLILEEISKRTAVEKELLLFSSPLELRIPLDNGFVVELKKRQKACLHYLDSDGDKFLTGDIVINFIEGLNKKRRSETERLYGSVANPGKIEGIAKIIFTTSDITKMKKGDILVAPNTRPEYVTAMKKAAAIITDEGGITSHAAIVSRELGLPCVIGLQNATDTLKDGDLIFVNANHGIVNVVKRKD